MINGRIMISIIASFFKSYWKHNLSRGQIAIFQVEASTIPYTYTQQQG